MSVNIVLPDLPNFVQGRITALYTAKTPAEFDSAFDAFVAEDARITLNGKHISRANYKKTIMGEIANDVSADVQFQGVVSVPADTTGKDLNAIGSGTVGAFFKAIVDGKLFVLGQRQSNTVNSSLNVVIAKDPSLHHHQIGFGGGFDARRAMVLDDVLTDVQNPITLPHPPTAPTASS